MIRYFLKILLLCLFPFLVNAQQKEVDGLHVALQNAPNDTIRMDLNDQIGLYYAERNHDSTLLYRDVALMYARKLNLKIDEADVLTGKGYILLTMQRFSESFQCLTEAINILEDPRNEKNLYPFSAPQGEAGTRLATLSNAKYVLGDLYGETGEREKQKLNCQESVQLAQTAKDTFNFCIALAELGKYYREVGNYDSALYYFGKSESLIYATSKYKCVLELWSAQVYLLKKEYDPAKETLYRAIQLAENQQNIATLGDIYLELAGLYRAKNQTDSSFNYAKKSLQTYRTMKRNEGIADASALIAEIFHIRNDPDSAYKYLQLSTTMRDSLRAEEKSDLSTFRNNDFSQQLKLQALQKEKEDDRNRIRMYALFAGLGVLFVIGIILYRNNRHKQAANKKLQQQKQKIEITLQNLKDTQKQLIQSEKMASLGELTAGIAHEIQNPLNFVNNFSEVNTELIEEADQEIDKGNISEVKTILNDIKENEQKINHHGKRADAIVKGMLQHSRSSSGKKEPTDINALSDEYLRLAYHGLRAKEKSFTAKFETDFDKSLPKINVVPQDIGRIILNLINNAFYAVSEKAKQNISGYEPGVIVSTKKINEKIEICVKDNGNGIPDSIKEKIFQPFFTTKPTGQGTGLGLSLSYDIVKAHGGEIKVTTKEGEGTEFMIQLPNV